MSDVLIHKEKDDAEPFSETLNFSRKTGKACMSV